MTNPKYRNWCFTINNYTAGEVEVLKNPDMLGNGVKYVVCGKEICPTTGTPHLQGYISFKNPCRMAHVKNFTGNRCRLAPANGTAYDTYKYVALNPEKPNPEFWEVGTRPMTQEEKGASEKKRYKRVIDLVTEGDMDTVADECPDIYIRHYSTLKRIKHDKIMERQLHDTEDRMLWYYGATGTGKSRKARTENPDAYLKAANTKWWDGYLDQEVAILEDLDVTHKWMDYHLKIWSDRYPFPAEVKGSTIKIRPRLLIVTSNYRPQDIWDSADSLGPLLRRFKVLEFRTDAEPVEI